MNGPHIIVQAGGRGTRLRHHTWNKPKCLVSVKGKPILYHLFDRFPEATFYIIGDHLVDKLEQYLHFAPPSCTWHIVPTEEKGTAAGIAKALSLIPPDAPTMLVWSDLILGALPPWPQTDAMVICTTSAFPCRWTVAEQGHLHEKPGRQNGIPGLFYVRQARLFPTPPAGGEFVKWLAATLPSLTLLDCPDMQELGDFATIEESNDRAGFCRFFNKVEIHATTVSKTVVDPAYAALHANEVGWYNEAGALGFRRIPKVQSTSPLVLERIQGQHLYQMQDLTARECRAVLADYLDSLIDLHSLASVPASAQEVEEVYLRKTLNRVLGVADIIPGFTLDSLTINGKKCKNVLADKHQGLLASLLPLLQPPCFSPIHGDPTFSNTMIDDKLRVWFIDPRGYFAKPGIMGDAWYDYAKVYYSAVGGYDAFNRRKFKLHKDRDAVEILMDTPFLAATAQDIFAQYFGKEYARIEILHGLIWLAFAGYAKDDMDSVAGAFYLGLYWLEKGMEKL